LSERAPASSGQPREIGRTFFGKGGDRLARFDGCQPLPEQSSLPSIVASGGLASSSQSARATRCKPVFIPGEYHKARYRAARLPSWLLMPK